jgi:hypothetical protein
MDILSANKSMAGGGGETLKYAAGTAQYVYDSHLLTVTSVGFKPYFVYFEYISDGVPSYQQGIGIGICNAQGTVVRAFSAAPIMGVIDPAGFTPNDDGFTLEAEFYGDATVAWYAVGK